MSMSEQDLAWLSERGIQLIRGGLFNDSMASAISHVDLARLIAIARAEGSATPGWLEQAFFGDQRNAGVLGDLAPHQRALLELGISRLAALSATPVRPSNLQEMQSVPGSATPGRPDRSPMLTEPPFADSGIGGRMFAAYHAYTAEYVYSTEGPDHELTEWEADLIDDFFNGLMGDDGIFGPVRELLALAVSATPVRLEREEVTKDLLATLRWYEEQAAGCRKLGQIGDPYRHALDADGGKRARDALSKADAIRSLPGCGGAA